MVNSSQELDASGSPESGGSRPSDGATPTHLRFFFLTVFTIDFSRFEVHFSFSVWVLIRDGISGHVWFDSYELIWHN